MLVLPDDTGIVDTELLVILDDVKVFVTVAVAVQLAVSETVIVIVLNTVEVIVTITVATAGHEPVDEPADEPVDDPVDELVYELVEVYIVEEPDGLQTGTTRFKPKKKQI